MYFGNDPPKNFKLYSFLNQFKNDGFKVSPIYSSKWLTKNSFKENRELNSELEFTDKIRFSVFKNEEQVYISHNFGTSTFHLEISTVIYDINTKEKFGVILYSDENLKVSFDELTEIIKNWIIY